MSLAFINGAKGNPDKQKWIETIGAYMYYSLILAAFDPVQARQIHDSPAHHIAQAYVTKMAYEYVEPQKNK